MNSQILIFKLHSQLSKSTIQHQNLVLQNTQELHFFTYILTFKTDLCIVGSQIILSIILVMQNNNHTQEHKIYVENPFSLKGNTTGQISNQFTIIKSITIIFVYISKLKKNLSYFSLLSHTNFLSKAATLCSLLSISFSTHNTLSWLSSFSKRPPLGCSLFSLVRLPLFLILLYAALFFCS